MENNKLTQEQINKLKSFEAKFKDLNKEIIDNGFHVYFTSIGGATINIVHGDYKDHINDFDYKLGSDEVIHSFGIEAWFASDIE